MAEKIVSTGIERLDEALINGEGVVLGSSILIEGSSGSGKELLSKQFASAGVGSETVVYFSTDETSDELIDCLLYTSPSPRDRTRSRMPSSA